MPSGPSWPGRCSQPFSFPATASVKAPFWVMTCSLGPGYSHQPQVQPSGKPHRNLPACRMWPWVGNAFGVVASLRLSGLSYTAARQTHFWTIRLSYTVSPGSLLHWCHSHISSLRLHGRRYNSAFLVRSLPPYTWTDFKNQAPLCPSCYPGCRGSCNEQNGAAPPSWGLQYGGGGGDGQMTHRPTN